MSNIFQAARQGNLARVQELLAQGGLDLAAFQPGDKLTALYEAARGGHLFMAKAFIRAGAPLNVPDEIYSALHGAVQASHHNLTAMLLREGAEVDSYTNHGGTPLAYAEDRRVAALLIAAGADVNASPLSPLHWAATHGHLAVLEVLLSHPDINVNKQEEQSQCTPLYFAARDRHNECVATLLAAGADACIPDKDEQTPLLRYFARHKNSEDFRTFVMLVAAGDRQWAYVPSPCPGLEAALLSVWKEAPQDLPLLFSRLTPEVKRRIRAALCTMHHTSPHHLPDHIRMRLLDEAFNV
jgi:ankyrin repeat protein